MKPNRFDWLPDLACALLTIALLTAIILFAGCNSSPSINYLPLAESVIALESPNTPANVPPIIIDDTSSSALPLLVTPASFHSPVLSEAEALRFLPLPRPPARSNFVFTVGAPPDEEDLITPPKEDLNAAGIADRGGVEPSQFQPQPQPAVQPAVQPLLIAALPRIACSGNSCGNLAGHSHQSSPAAVVYRNGPVAQFWRQRPRPIARLVGRLRGR